jgi:L-amino acid N-acyltransferase YncA
MIRRAEIADAAGIRSIYNQAVTETTHTFDLVPRTLEDQREWIAQRQGSLAAIVAVSDNGAILGFASLSRYKERPAYSTTVENSVYVATNAHRQGVGSALLEALVQVARDHGYHSIMARIADAQEASITLHTKHGFELVGIEREVGRKFGRWLNVALMQRLL